MGYLFDMDFTRDVWMHRIDLAGATSRKLDLDGGHDARIVADIVAEWATRHSEHCTLDLSGPAGDATSPAPAASTWRWTPSSSAGSCPAAATAGAS